MGCEVIRRATADDIDALMPMAERFYAVCPWRHVAAYDPGTSRAGMMALLENENAGLFVIDAFDALKGAVGFVLTPVWLAENFTIAQEVFWWVEPDVSREAIALLKAGEGWAQSSGAKASVMIRLDGMRDEALHRLYLRFGYNPVEHHYVRKLG